MKNLKFKSFVIIASLALTMTACSSNDNQAKESVEQVEVTEEKNAEATLVKTSDDKIESTESVESSESTEKVETSEKGKDKKINDGRYVSTFASSQKGELIDGSIATVYEVESDGSSLKVSGSIQYLENSEETDSSGDILENSTYDFKVDENTKYQAVGGLAEAQIFSLEEFNKFAKDVADSGLALIIEVENGLAKNVSISS